MNVEEKSKIGKLRNMGFGYTKIAKQLNLSVDTVKSYCKRNNLGGVNVGNSVQLCDLCAKPVKQNAGRKVKRFCSDACRSAWWSKHTQLVKRQANYECVCCNCGESFTSYGNKTRKYCCHACYIEHRFGGEHHADK